jgi:hypothetical protein
MRTWRTCSVSAGDRRDHLVEADRDAAVLGAVEAHRRRRAQQVAGRQVPVLALAAVPGQLHRVAVGGAQGLVDVEHRLHRVLARRQLGETGDRVAEDAGADHRFLPRRQPFDVDAEDLGAGELGGDLEARLALAAGRDDQQHASVHGLGALLGAEGDGELEAGGGRRQQQSEDGEAGDGRMDGRHGGSRRRVAGRVKDTANALCARPMPTSRPSSAPPASAPSAGASAAAGRSRRP